MSASKTSRIPGFYRLSLEERVQKIAEFAGLDEEQTRALAGLNLESADKMVENAVGVFGLPIGIATNFVINDREVLVPMAIEEASVIAAASAGAKAARFGGGFTAESSERRMNGQVQVVGCADYDAARRALEESREDIIRAADELAPRMVERGGGVREVRIRLLGQALRPEMLVVQLVVDTVDAMGANAINSIAEGLAPLIASISGGRVLLRILSNYTDQCLTVSSVRIPPAALSVDPVLAGEMIDGIVAGQRFAELDPYRAVTHNKGVMNGIDAVVLATGNDWRAVEAAAHAWAARSGQYGPMTEWTKDADGHLVGRLELPMAVAIVGGGTQLHPTARVARELLGVSSARELSEVVVSAGLAQNFSALRALATDGIQKGHMALHARNVAATAGARGAEVDRIAAELVRLNDIKVERAQALLARGKQP